MLIVAHVILSAALLVFGFLLGLALRLDLKAAIDPLRKGIALSAGALFACNCLLGDRLGIATTGLLIGIILAFDLMAWARDIQRRKAERAEQEQARQAASAVFRAKLHKDIEDILRKAERHQEER